MPRKKKSNKAPPPEELNRKNQLQAVLLADSFTSTFRPITREQPKVLLPICNVPMIDLTLEWLAANGVCEVFVMCCAHADKVRQHLTDAHIWNVVQPEEDSSGGAAAAAPAAAPGPRPHCRHSVPIVHVECVTECTVAGAVLRYVDDKQLITSDPFVVVSGDTISNMNLGAAVEAHRQRRQNDKSNIMSLVFMPAKTSHPTREYTDDLVVAMDHNTQQIVSFDNDMHSGTFGLGLDLLKEHRQMDFRYDLLDCNIDICSPEVLIHFSDNYDYEDIRRDYVHNEVQNKELGWKYYAYVIENEYAARVQDLCTYDSICRDMLRRWTYPLVPDNNIHGTTNLKLYGNGVFKEDGVRTRRSVKLGPNVILGSGSVLDENVRVANATLGRNVRIGANVSIVNSYIWDDVVIEADCVINGAVICNGARLGRGCIVSPGTVVSFGAALPAATTSVPCSRYTNIAPAPDAFGDVPELDPALEVGPANNAADGSHTATTVALLRVQRADGAATTRRWTVNEWDIALSDHDDDEDDDDDDDDDGSDSAAPAEAQAVMVEKQKLVKLHHTSITSDIAVKQRRWYTWEGVDLVALGYESESDDDDDDVSERSVDGSDVGSSYDEDFSNTGGGKGGAAAGARAGSLGAPDPQVVKEAMGVIETMVMHAIEKQVDSIGLEVRAFMAAQNLAMADAGAAVLRGFLRQANVEGAGKKNNIIIALNKIMVTWTPLLLKFSSGYGAHEQSKNQLRLLYAAEAFARGLVLGASSGSSSGGSKSPVAPQPHWRQVLPAALRFLFQHDVVKEEALRQYKMEREETTPTGAPEDDLFSTDQMQQVLADILDDDEDSDSSDSADSSSSSSSSSD